MRQSHLNRKRIEYGVSQNRRPFMQDDLERKLTAILYADVAGYSRLTDEDEEGTHRRLSEYLDRFAQTIAEHKGRVVHYAGDAVLAEIGRAHV